MLTDAAIRKFREVMLAAVDDRGADLPLSYSGGADSTTVLAAQVALGAQPRLYTFALDGVPSDDLDAARTVAHELFLDLVEVRVSASRGAIRDNARIVLDLADRAGRPLSKAKVYVECGTPFLYLAETAVARGDTRMLFAMIADDLYGMGRKYAVLAAREGEEVARADRRSAVLDTVRMSDNVVVDVAASRGLALDDPFRDPRVRDLLLDLDIADLNRPRPKEIAARAFPEIVGRFYRRPSPLQIAGRIRETYAERLIGSDASPTAVVAAAYRRIHNEQETLL